MAQSGPSPCCTTKRRKRANRAKHTHTHGASEVLAGCAKKQEKCSTLELRALLLVFKNGSVCPHYMVSTVSSLSDEPLRLCNYLLFCVCVCLQ